MTGSQTITVDGRLFSSLTSDTPLIDSSVVMDIKIYNPALSCILYEEKQTVDTSQTEGRFTVNVGSAVGASKRVSGEPGNPMTAVFQNAQPIAGSCGVYTPAAGDVRYVRITIAPSTTGTVEVLSPDTIVDQVPNALVAETLQGLTSTNFVQTDTAALTQSNVANIFSSTNYPLLTALLGGSSSSYVKSSVNGASIPTVAGVPASLAQGQIWFNSSANAFQYYNGSAVQTLGIAGSGITALTVGSSLTAGGVAGGTLNSSGTIDLVNSGVVTGSYAKVTVNSKGLVTYGTGLVEADVPQLTTAGHVLGDAIVSGTIGGSTAFYSSGNVTTSGTVQGTYISSTYDMTRRLSIYGTGSSYAVSLSAPSMGAPGYGLVLPASQGAAGTVLVNDGSGNLSWAASTSGSVTSVGLALPSIFSVTTPVVTSTGTLTATLASQNANMIFAGPASGAAGTPSFRGLAVADLPAGYDASVQKNSLASGQMWIGNSAGVAAAVTPFGDVVFSIAGSATVSQLQGRPVSATAPSAAGQVLRWSGGAWTPNFVAMTDLRSTITGNNSFQTSCAANQTLTYNSVGDMMSCSNIAIANTQVAWGSTGANLVFAGPATGGSAAPAFRALTAADLPPGTTSQWNTVSTTINYLAGFVGIGTATPQATLDVYGTGASSAMLVPRDTSGARPTGVNGMIRYNTTSNAMETYSNGSWTTLATAAAGASQWTTSGSSIFYSSGNVGIGTSSPSAPLHVLGGGIYFQNGTANGIGQLYNDGGVHLMGEGSTNGGLYFSASNGMAFRNTANGSNYSYLSMTGGTSFINGSGGNLGIGSTLASATLHLNVNGSANADTFLIGNNSTKGFSVRDTGTDIDLVSIGHPLWINGVGQSTYLNANGGLVGVGTYSPSAILDVYGTGTNSAIVVPRASTSNRPTGVNGMIRYNTDFARLETYSSGAWNGITTSTASGGSYLPLAGGTLTGAVAFPQGTASAPSLNFGDATSGLFSTGSGNVSLATTSTSRLTVNASGNVGIGTANPSYLLHVFGGDVLVDDTAGNARNIGFKRSGSFVGTIGTNSNAFTLNALNGSDLNLQTTGGITVKGTTGRVGIGTSTPTTALEVDTSSSTGNPGGIFINSNDATGNAPAPVFRARGTRLDNNASQSFAGGLVLEHFNLNAATTNGQQLGTIFFGGNVDTTPTMTYAASISGVADSAFTSASSAPTALVFYTGTSGNPLATANLTYGTEAMRITSGRLVGIGTSAPGAALDVNATGAASAILVPRDTSANRPTGANGMIRYNTSLSQLETYSSGAWNGLATTAVGGGSSQWTTSGSNIYYNSSGNVGIGTNAPLQTLDLVGNLNVHNQTGAYYLANAPVLAEPGGTTNLSVGTGAAPAPSNIANTAVGYQALNAIGNAYYNTAVGYQALKANTTGVQNNAIGANALIANTTGLDNQALGFNALSSNTTGSSNVAIGDTALSQNTTSGNNVAIGFTALQNSTGASNTAVGYGVANQMTTGANNSVFGSSAGVQLTTGVNNLILGASVGASNLKTGSNNILIGSNAYVDTPAASTSNFLNIGNLIFGTSMSGTLSAPAGSVGIGTIAPQAILDVNGSGAQSAMLIPRDSSANRPTGINGMIRYNTSTAQLETYSSGAWNGVATNAAGGGASQWTTSGSNIYYSNGSVGIGTATPAGILDVEGGTASSGVSGTSINIVSQSGGPSANTNGGNIILTTGTGNGTGSAGYIQLNSPKVVLPYWGANILTQGVYGMFTGNVGYGGASSGTTDFVSYYGLNFVADYRAVYKTPNLSIAVGGNVGIGTASPGSILDIYAQGTNSAMILPRDTSANRPTGVNGMIRYNTDLAKLETYSSGAWSGIATGTSGATQWANGASNSINYTSGFVGAGTASPVASMDVYQDFTYDQATAGALNVVGYSHSNKGFSTSLAAANFTLNNGQSNSATIASSIIGTTNNNNVATSVNGGTFTANSTVTFPSYINGVSATSNFSNGGTTGNVTGGRFTASVSSGSTATTGIGVYSTVTSSGTVTTGYGLYLDTVAGVTKFGLYENSGGKNYFAGNVGVGTASPAAPLDIKNSTAAAAAIFRADSTYGAPNQIQINGTTNPNQVLYIGYNSSQNYGSIAAYSGSISQYLALNPLGGNVGVGTALPAAALEVVGTGAYSSLLVPRDTTANRPGGVNGMIRYNTSVGQLETYASGAWAGVATSALNGGASQWANNSTTIYYTGGNVGIGTNSANSLLNVGGTTGNGTTRQSIQINEAGIGTPSYDGAYSVGDKLIMWNTSGLVKNSIGNDSYGLWLQSSASPYSHVAVWTGGTSGAAPTERMRVDAYGNVGIGTNNPSSILHVSGPSPFVTITGTETSAKTFALAESAGSMYIKNMTDSGGSWNFRTSSNTDVMTIAGAGNVGIGTTLPAFTLSAVGTIGAYNSDWVSTSAGTGIRMGLGASSGTTYGVLQTVTNGNSAAGILSLNPGGGNVGIGTSNPSYLLHVAGDIALNGNIRALNGFANAGSSTLCGSNGGAAGYIGYCSSDRRLKKDIKYMIDDEIDTIMKLKPVNFRWKASPDREIAGFIAQDVQKQIPEAVYTVPNQKYLGFDSNAIVSHLVKAFQDFFHRYESKTAEQDARIKKLEEENQELRAALCAQNPTLSFCAKAQ